MEFGTLVELRSEGNCQGTTVGEQYKLSDPAAG